MMTVDADQNLLFGILALQMGLIGPEDLVAAFRAWSKDRTRPLALRLIESGSLAEDDRALLEALARRHVATHDGDSGRSLAAATAALHPATADALRRDAEPELQATLAHASGPDGDSDASFAWSPAPADGRYQALRPHARGALGMVSVALDRELHREVALKEIQERFADDPTSRARFLLEAEVTGRLEHPGVVPVYGLGTDARGRPYYAMRFVRGQSLKEAIDRFHKADADPHRDPGARMLELRALLTRFLDVCNAISYAHDRGVIHRDLKPANILLGPYGETLVVDWGLAKVVGRADPAASGESPLQPAVDSGSTETEAGSIVGTPAYMSPEQARGDLESLGPVSDVYSLGATLYCLLVGRPAQLGGDVATVLDRVRRGDFPAPRQANRRVPPALESIVLKAMATEPAGRYGAARALAEDLEHWLADEPVAAHREPIGARLGRWARRHRALVTSATALLITTTLGLAVGATLLGRANAEISRQRGLALENLGRAERAAAQLRSANVQVEQRRREAEANFLIARDAVDRYLTQVSENRLLNEPHMERLRKELLRTARDFYQKLVDQRKDDPLARVELGRAYYRLARIEFRLGDTRASRASGRKARDLLADLSARHPDRPDFGRELAGTYDHLGALESATGRFPDSESAFRQGLAIRRALAGAHPGAAEYQNDLAGSYNNLGALYSTTGRPKEAEPHYRRALGLRRKLAEASPDVARFRDDLAESLINLGALEQATGRFPAAEQSYREALALRQGLVDREPENTEYRVGLAAIHNNLGVVYSLTGRTPEAIREHEQALALRQGLTDAHLEVAGFRSALARSHNNLGIIYYEAHRYPEAEAAYRRALTIRRKLVEDHPEVNEYRVELTGNYNNLGTLYQDLDRPADAEAAFREALRLMQGLAAAHPDKLDLGTHLGGIYCNLGSFRLHQGDPRAACDWFARAITTLEGVLRREPRFAPARQYLRNAHGARADTLVGLGRFAEAVADWDRVIEFDDGRRRAEFRVRRAIVLARAGDHRRAAAEVAAAAPGPEYALGAACALAQASAAAARDPGLAPPARAAAADRLAAAALGRLRQAEAAGYFTIPRRRDQLAAEHDLGPLRDRADFRAWAAGLDAPDFPENPFAP